MAKRSRNIGLEILAGIRQIKRGEHGRITEVPSVASVKEKSGLSPSKFNWPQDRQAGQRRYGGASFDRLK